ncbi:MULTISPECIES: DoxX family protein [unclassified Mesorhizobium]|uniref:DoxX family protein n=1 Tax=unclassified Mesorhizobium TaxID=325217 RepID=UPI000FD2A626|nr:MULTISPECIES: DoxX family protein [unclassified Mesorhizobium]RUW96968.1 DoxX family protein [Mesorhizobium sp. M8A.F.Ca.ET.023.01.1.1]TGV53767.1 DoxX family protein [bacterium M00.F.Ca.ET.141.01.1.1]RWC73948.1 MAG: DoxX family protein [Mesorhizobium sp.]TGP95808.1 DoxX family protein [Mesorhizobium sp. M8A.F.Ca.ET.218.01.1.1]TGT18861.1 DoxX family protein [Mesorhizobium sp. M8A.F.Ca.ET.213.01.1.1]
MGRNALLMVSRLLFAVLFVPSGFQALANIAGTTSYFSGLGLPLPALAAWGTGLFELIAGLLILVGFQTRIVALLLAAFCIAAGYIGHHGQGAGDATLAFLHQQMLMKDIAISGGFLALAMAGAGAWSADGRGFGIGADAT